MANSYSRRVYIERGRVWFERLVGQRVNGEGTEDRGLGDMKGIEKKIYIRAI